jgi:hypothetical protein
MGRELHVKIKCRNGYSDGDDDHIVILFVFIPTISFELFSFYDKTQNWYNHSACYSLSWLFWSIELWIDYAEGIS